MTTHPSRLPSRLLVAGLLTTASFAGIGRFALAAQTPPDPAHAAHVASGAMPPDAAPSGPSLAQQISQLQTKVAQLEANLAKNAPPMSPVPAGAAMPGMPAAPMPKGMSMDNSKATPPATMPGMAAPAAPAPAMGMMGMMAQMMGMMDKMMPMAAPGAPMPSGAMPAPTPGGTMPMPMEDKKEMAGMMGMGAMPTAGAMPASALPGFPGASHLYHVGATGFFLDHPQHITLTTTQQAGLNQAREQALLAKSTADRAVEQAEQMLWTLTAADQPNGSQIEAKIREIESLRGDARLAFIRAVGEASKLLTEEQRKILTGFAPPAPMAPMPASAAAMSDM